MSDKQHLNVFIIGITGKIGNLLAQILLEKGDTVRRLVRRADQQTELAIRGIQTEIGDIASLPADQLAASFGNADVIVFSAGSNAGSREATQAIDDEGLARAVEASRQAGIKRFASVSVLPESWRERNLSEDEEYYFAAKKKADILLSRSDLDWVILRPSLLVDDPGTGTVSMGPAEFHGQIAREDVAATLAELLHEPRIGRQILELNEGSISISEAIAAHIR